jgi:hypothetical protein
VRHLEEAVARGDGPDPDGLEEDVVARLAGDGRKPNVFDRAVRSDTPRGAGFLGAGAAR